ncbi:hypothetical protein HYC85_030975 [Camellia sinensis]|uniref:Uncharacterized protein n=1 Tax=Camellia sinensis TaxID=4442 RepID=A0A7J7FPR4_CAMSI|nr:hypothetical protein HYC85_030975 [Camellia sinensis]
MAASRCVLSSSSSYCSYMISYAKPQFVLNYSLSSPSSSSSSPLGKCRIVGFLPQNRAFHRAEAEVLQKPAAANPPLSSSSSSSSKEFLPKIDKSGRFCSPRAARELALLIIYAACLEGSDPVRLFEKRMNAPREPGFQFDKALLTEYNHMSFGGPPVTAETVEEADELMRNDANQSAIACTSNGSSDGKKHTHQRLVAPSWALHCPEAMRRWGRQQRRLKAEVLSAPPKLVYSKLILRFTRKLLVAVVDRWDSHVLVIDKVAPSNWKV